MTPDNPTPDPADGHLVLGPPVVNPSPTEEASTPGATPDASKKTEHAVLRDFTFTQKDGSTTEFKVGDVFQSPAYEDVSALVADGKISPAE